MRTLKDLAKILDGKDVLYVPIVSCIDRDTNEYNLAADGNVNRFITTFSKCNTYKSLTIVLPSKHKKDSENIIESFVSDNKASIVWVDNFGIHAKDQRLNDDVIEAIYNSVIDKSFDVSIVESQRLALRMDYETNIWWNVVSETDKKTRDFLQGYTELNDEVIRYVDYMIISSPDQCEFYHTFEYKLIYIDELIDRSLKYFDYEVDEATLEALKDYDGKIFYLPFRLTDQGYMFDKVLEYIKKYGGENCLVLYSDPNKSNVITKLDDPIKDRFRLVSVERPTYYTILDKVKATILYFEDLEFINHAAIHEFLSATCICNVILYRQFKNPYGVNACERVKIIDKI